MMKKNITIIMMMKVNPLEVYKFFIRRMIQLYIISLEFLSFFNEDHKVSLCFQIEPKDEIMSSSK